MKPNLSKLSKKEIVWLDTHKCKHGHSYLEHYNCYLTEHPDRERIGFLDIETSNLQADFGIILTYCIKDSSSDKIFESKITKKELNTVLDKRITKDLVRDMMLFDRVVTQYGKRFDLPFVRTRALINNIDFPNYGAINHTDVYFITKYKLKLHSNRLENVCKMITGETNKTHIEPEYWLKALQGDEKSLNYILQHNRYDVLDLERYYWKVINFIKENNTSI